MSSSSWIGTLNEILGWRKSPAQSRLALLGVGNQLRGDDGAGATVTEELLHALGDSPPAGIQILTVATAPENFTGKLRKFAPQQVVFVDAADFGGSPGEIRWLDWRASTGFGASTHLQAFHLNAAWLEQELQTRVSLLGIQPLHTDFDQPLSAPVRGAVSAIVSEFLRALV